MVVGSTMIGSTMIGSTTIGRVDLLVFTVFLYCCYIRSVITKWPYQSIYHKSQYYNSPTQFRPFHCFLTVCQNFPQGFSLLMTGNTHKKKGRWGGGKIGFSVVLVDLQYVEQYVYSICMFRLKLRGKGRE